MSKWWLIILFCGGCLKLTAQLQDSLQTDSLRAKLELLAQRDPAYLSEVDISAGKMALDELLRHVARVNEVNLSVKGGSNIPVSCNFSRTRVTDLLAFLCREYELNLDVVGNIVSLYPRPLPPPARPPLVIDYDSTHHRMSCDVRDHRLVEVVRRISETTGLNIVVPRQLYDQLVSGYLRSLPPEELLRTLAEANGLQALQGGPGVWTVQSRMEGNGGNAFPVRPAVFERIFTPDQLAVDSLAMLTVMINQGNLQDIVRSVCQKLKLNYFFVSPLMRQTSIYARQISFTDLLDVLFTGTDYTYRVQDGIYLFSSSAKEQALITTEVIPMKYRTISKVPELIPDALKQDVQVVAFPDQNSLIVSGDARKVGLVGKFLASIDKSVPLITIEVMIVDVKKSMIQEAGLNFGLNSDKSTARTTGSLSPGLQMNFSPSSINKLINSFNGFGAVNLGRVKPDFYLNLKLLEENGTIELRSTPKLSTLNGHEATLKSGEMKYYKEVLNNIIGTQNPIQSESYTWKSVEANLSVKIIPLVSTDEHITLDIEIEQSEFTAREGKEEDAPPGTMTRSFKSQIRVMNDEMVLLGGIEHNSRDKTSSGLPFLARIPVLKWIFGESRNNKVEEKLNVFIKPHVIY